MENRDYNPENKTEEHLSEKFEEKTEIITQNTAENAILAENEPADEIVNNAPELKIESDTTEAEETGSSQKTENKGTGKPGSTFLFLISGTFFAVMVIYEIYSFYRGARGSLGAGYNFRALLWIVTYAMSATAMYLKKPGLLAGGAAIGIVSSVVSTFVAMMEFPSGAVGQFSVVVFWALVAAAFLMILIGAAVKRTAALVVSIAASVIYAAGRGIMIQCTGAYPFTYSLIDVLWIIAVIFAGFALRSVNRTNVSAE